MFHNLAVYDTGVILLTNRQTLGEARAEGARDVIALGLVRGCDGKDDPPALNAINELCELPAFERALSVFVTQAFELGRAYQERKQDEQAQELAARRHLSHLSR